MDFFLVFYLPTTKFSKILCASQLLYIFFAATVHPIIPPLLSTEAPDATGPSLPGGHGPPPGRKVSGLGGPELMRPTL